MRRRWEEAKARELLGGPKVVVRTAHPLFRSNYLGGGGTRLVVELPNIISMIMRLGGECTDVRTTITKRVERFADNEGTDAADSVAGRGGRRIYENTVTNIGHGKGSFLDQESWDVTAGHLAPNEASQQWFDRYRNPEPFWSCAREAKPGCGFPDGKGKG